MSSDVRLVWVSNAMLTAALLLAPSLSRAADQPGAATPAAAAPTAGAPQAAAPRPTFQPVEAGPIAEDTTVQGKLDANLKGVWLLVANAELVPGKFKTFPQIFKISGEKDGLKFQILDVQLPDDVKQAVKTANSRTLQAWQPDDAMLKELQQSWSTLAPAKLKYTGDPLYSKLHYKLVGPDQYSMAFNGADEALIKIFKDSKFAFLVQEEYAPRDLGPDSRIAQMITRSTVYAVHSIDKDTIKGDIALDFIAAGSGTPIPYKFAGSFAMYRLAQ